MSGDMVFFEVTICGKSFTTKITYEGSRDFVRNIPQAIGFGSMEENLINQALMDAMQGVGDAVSDTAAYQAFVEPALQDIAPDAMEFYEGLDPRVQGQLSGIFEYIGNAIR